jgi:peptidoglycan hydrolase CwlO-like protein
MKSSIVQSLFRWKFTIFCLLFSLVIYHLSFGILAFAQSCAATDYDCQINQIQREIDALAPAHENNKKELANTRSQVDSLTKRIATLGNQLNQTQKDMEARQKDLSYAQHIFEEKSKNHYKFLRLYDPLIPFLASNDAVQAYQEITFRQKAADSDIKTMEGYGQDLLKLKQDKETLEKNKVNLASSKDNLSKHAAFLAGEVAKTEQYLTTLDAKQEELIAAKAGGFQTTVGDTPPTSEPCSGPPGSANFCDPGFRPAFAGFSFGVPHRTGMSQYGAYGRSKSGQTAEKILSDYFQGAELNKNYAVPASISVTGVGTVPFEDNYMLGIYEIYEAWGNTGGFEALKAQAVVSRSYALAYSHNATKPICTNENCQVYKRQLKSGKWAEAVRATRGWVMTKGGAPASTYFAITNGGFSVTNWGWTGIVDTVGGSTGNWPGQAYDKIGGSPWFYKGWYKDRSGKSCGKSNPWLTSEQMADVVNAWTVLTKGGGDVNRIVPTDTSCWKGNPYSLSDLQGIGGYSSVSSVSVVYGNDGSTKTVNVSTNKGSVSIPGEELKKAFNLRAPGYVGIKSSLFNIEKL